MRFEQAFKAMKHGAKVKLPSWGGYWYWDKDCQTIVMHTKDGEDIDIRDMQVPDYTFTNICSDEWMIADGENCPELGGTVAFSFGDAIKYLKRGMRVKRQGWNGKNQYIELASNISYQSATGDMVNAKYDTTGNKAILFVVSPGVQIGWLPSQEDMLAEDWIFAD